ncbi:small-subunit processome [Scleroderma yunnanense]
MALIHRPTHKERSQLSHRARLGALEKHKDYVLRARDYHEKKDRLNRLRQKAVDRNKDEFYFAMNKEKTVGGVHVQDRGNVAMPMDMVKLLKTQDEGYIRTMRNLGLKKIDKIKSQLTALANLVPFSDADVPLDDSELETLRAAGIIPRQSKSKGRRKQGATPRLIIFAEDEADVQRHLQCQQSISATEGTEISALSADQVDLGWKTVDSTSTKSRRRRKRNQAAEGVGDSPTEEETQENIKHRGHLLKELAARLARDTQLLYALRELEMQRQLVGKGGRRKIRGVEEIGSDEGGYDSEDKEGQTPKRKPVDKTYKPRIYKWRIERKR